MVTDKNNRLLPVFCLLVVSKVCNFRCKMCNMWKNRERKIDRKELTIEEIRGFVDDLKTVTTEPIFIHLIGGETLLRQDLPEIISYIKNSGFNSSITTNGYYIDEEMAKKIVQSKLTGIFLSLDGFKEETHDYLRGVKGSYRRVMEAIDLLDKYRGTGKSNRLSIGITMTMMEKNLDEIIDLVEWANHNEKINDLFLNASLQPFDCDDQKREWFKESRHSEVWPQDPARIQDILEKLALLKEKGYKICNPPEQLRLIKGYFTNPYRFIHDQKVKCPRGDLAPEVNAYGDINICFFMEPIGNIREKKFSEVWFSEKMKQAQYQINTCKKDCDIAVNCFYKIENIIDHV
ncbi:MAG: radical SAM protein [Candidatus Omnitrophota bacterium]|nr:radical SAM protein [Candidatus Omnitrophota bacterium]MBU1928349.1 radical SAM protein [Candidatus Omnitrophota bacterium]MBU2034330.1 radical SAM protein [Candidatus Omnitrophota bacterium]MBU2221530.1 radical SAM protein [Candidatus Omnitrophota bacterium]MBU2257727.1 radical SAM protein [Candidatus Omnitrophota bacterium]